MTTLLSMPDGIYRYCIVRTTAAGWLATVTVMVSLLSGLPPVQSLNADPCSNRPCQKGGTCTRISQRYYSCACKRGFEGENCSQRQAAAHVNVGLESATGALRPVVVDGIAGDGFVAEHPTARVGGDEVHLRLTNVGNTTLHFEQPLVVTSQSGKIVTAMLIGSSRKGGMLSGVAHGADNLLTAAGRQLVLRQRCLVSGTASVAVHIPVSGGMNLTFGWTRTCALNSTAPITVSCKDAFTDATTPVFMDGQIKPAFASNADFSTRFTVPSGLKATVFRLTKASRRSEMQSHVAVVTMGRPIVHADRLAVANPVITGHGAHGATLAAPMEIRVQHNCLDFGTAIFTLVLNFASYRCAFAAISR